MRLSDEERALLTARAQRAGLSISETVRLMLRGLLTEQERRP